MWDGQGSRVEGGEREKRKKERKKKQIKLDPRCKPSSGGRGMQKKDSLAACRESCRLRYPSSIKRGAKLAVRTCYSERA